MDDKLMIRPQPRACMPGNTRWHSSVTAITIYWYFNDKDDVLVAVLDVELAAHMADYQSVPFASLAERLLWVVNRLEQVSQLVSTAHTRLHASAALNDWQTVFTC